MCKKEGKITLLNTLNMLQLSNNIYNSCNKAIFISGSARSGTTILGKIVNSMKNVEYVFEPPILFSLFRSYKNMEENSWKLLYETYLFEDFLIDSLSGRNINCNRHDDSSIYNVKTEKEVEERHAKSWRRSELENLSRESIIAYKMPDVVDFIPQLQLYYPGTRVIILLRHPNDILNSFVNKGWFTDESLKSKSQLFWPSWVFGDYKIPHSVKEEDIDQFVSSNELERIAYYYNRSYSAIEKIHGAVIVDYKDLVNDTEGVVSNISKNFGLEFGDKTQEIMDSIVSGHEDVSTDLLSKLDKKEQEDLLSIYEKTKKFGSS